MIKTYGLLAVRPGMSVEDFHEHWRTVHREHAQRIDRIRRYVQAHRVRGDLAGLPAAEWEGTPEVWFDDLQSATDQRTDPQYLQGAHLDEPAFIDMDRVRRVQARDRVVRDPGAATGKVMVFAHHPGAPDAEALESAVTSLLEVPGLAGLVLAVAVPDEELVRQPDGSSPAAQPFDVVVELWWADQPALGAAWGMHGARVLDVLGGALDLSRARLYRCKELRVRG